MKDEMIKRIKELSRNLYESIIQQKKPQLSMPVRSLSNVDFDKAKGYFEIGNEKKTRTLTVNTSKTFAQTLRMLSLSKSLIETDDIATKREAYYVSKNWGEARFLEQPESDMVMDDIEAMFMVNREQIGFIPEEKGGDVSGELIVVDKDPETGKEIKIDCTKMGTGAYSIPSSVEHLQFETTANFILAIETAGMYQRLVKHAYFRKSKSILISLGGVPTRACRRFIRRLSDEKDIPVYVFTDGDPYGYLNIYRTLKVGSGNAAHINKFFCVPKAKYMGITPGDINDYKLPTHPLKEVDIKRVKDGFKNDPFVKAYPEWQKALNQMVEMKKRAEQQALAQHGLNFVITDYLPQKLENQKTWLP
ncbi:MAG: DNA topoisomerase IV subunit A [Candidatus Woesearchaeota archaeon]|nr:DNA topoisomerase IV subunit A [Candidatus Woesearchaeota archaeon]